MEETDREKLERQRSDADGAVVFLLVLLCSLLLSLSASLTQRCRLCRQYCRYGGGPVCWPWVLWAFSCAWPFRHGGT